MALLLVRHVGYFLVKQSRCAEPVAHISLARGTSTIKMQQTRPTIPPAKNAMNKKKSCIPNSNKCVYTLYRLVHNILQMKEKQMAPTKKPIEHLLDQRMVIMMSKAEIELIDDWMFSQRIRSRGEAVRRLVTAGMLKNLKQMKDARGSKAGAEDA